MAKKAKLDILEVNIDNKKEDAPSLEHEPENVEGGAASFELPPQNRSITKIKAWLRVHLLWLILISFLLIGLIVGAFVWYGWEGEKQVIAETSRSVSSEILPAVKERIVYFEGFAVDQKDDKGGVRIAFFDIAIELERLVMTNDLGERTDVRNVIYTVLKGKKAEEGLLAEKRNLVKSEIKNDLNRLLGEGAVREVYFTKYELY